MVELKCSKCGREIKELVKVERILIERRSKAVLKDGKLKLENTEEEILEKEKWYECTCGALITVVDVIAEAILEGKSKQEVQRIFDRILELEDALR